MHERRTCVEKRHVFRASPTHFEVAPALFSRGFGNPMRQRGEERTSVFPCLRGGFPKERNFKTYAAGYQTDGNLTREFSSRAFLFLKSWLRATIPSVPYQYCFRRAFPGSEQQLAATRSAPRQFSHLVRDRPPRRACPGPEPTILVAEDHGAGTGKDRICEGCYGFCRAGCAASLTTFRNGLGKVPAFSRVGGPIPSGR